MKRIIAGVLLFIAPISSHAAELTFPPLTGRVVDTAHQIPDDQEKILNRELTDFEKTTGHQFVVVTVPNLQGREPEEFALELGRHWKIGRAGANDGVILLQSPENNEPGRMAFRIEVGRGLEYVLTDAETSRIYRHLIVDKVQEDRPRSETVPEALIAASREIMRLGHISPEEKQEMDRKAAEAQAKALQKAADGFKTFLFWLVVIGSIPFLCSFIYLFVTRKERRRKREEKEKKRAADLAAYIERQERASKAMRQRAEEARKAREAMLAAMTPVERMQFLERERLAQREKEARLEAQRIQEREEQERRRQSEESNSSFGGYYSDFGSSSNGPSSSSDDSDFFGGGGDFGGGGSGGRI